MTRTRQRCVLSAALGAVSLLGCTSGREGNAPAPTSEVGHRFADASADPIEPLPREVPIDAPKVALGQRLFEDPRLSGDGKVACSTCHLVERGMADGAARSRPAGRDKATRYNSP